jgi:hypothetical protein
MELENIFKQSGLYIKKNKISEKSNEINSLKICIIQTIKFEKMFKLFAGLSAEG